jgi:hypothetical protein
VKLLGYVVLFDVARAITGVPAVESVSRAVKLAYGRGRPGGVLVAARSRQGARHDP